MNIKRKLALILCICIAFGAVAYAQENSTNSQEIAKEQKIDIDLTLLNATMSYGQMFDMLVNPKNYESKIVKVKGQFVKYFDDIQKKTYYLVNIIDQAGCCAMGVEFVPKDINNWQPPLEGDEIIVTGTFTTYIENGNTYASMVDCIIEK